MNRKYILYDGRANNGTANASILTICENETEAKNLQGKLGDMVCYSYTTQPPNKLIDEQYEWSWPT